LAKKQHIVKKAANHQARTKKGKKEIPLKLEKTKCAKTPLKEHILCLMVDSRDGAAGWFTGMLGAP